MQNHLGLPDQPTVVKAVWRHDTLYFGTLFTLSQSLYTRSRQLSANVVELVHPEAFEYLRNGVRSKQEQQKLLWYNDNFDAANFVSLYIDVPHEGINMADVPIEILYLLSAHLLTGEKLNFRNFSRYIHTRDLKFLPFLILPTATRFFVYIPTQKPTQTVREYSRELEPRLKPAIRAIRKNIQLVYGLVRLSEAAMLGVKGLETNINDLESELEQTLEAHTKQYGLLYTYLPGSQDTTLFHY